MIDRHNDLHSGERQVGESVDKIQPDHIIRYNAAIKKIHYLMPKNIKLNILDCACGVGYGSYLMAQNTNSNITAIDISEQAIEYAKRYFNNENINYWCDDCLKVVIADDIVDCVVCFETIEHVERDQELLRMFSKCLKPNGLLFLSFPNKDNYPIDNHPFHVRHYNEHSISKLLSVTNFSILEVYSQYADGGSYIGLTEGWNGRFNFLVCKKKSSGVIKPIE